jgi:hypothetical protein
VQRDGDAMSLAGRLEDLALSDIFQILSVGRKTGIFIVNGSKGAAVIVFKNGLVVRAETSDLEDTLGDNLRKAGLIKDTILNMALEVKKKLPSKSIAEVLFDFGSVSADAVEKVAKKRIEKVIYRLLLWEEGDFQFELDDLDLSGKADLLDDFGWELSKGLSPEYLLMEGARVQDESTQASFVPEEDFSDLGQEEESGWDDGWESPPPERKDISALKSLTQELRFPNSSSEITLLILRFASDIFQRGVLFMVGKNEIVGLGQFGLEIERADETVRETMLSFGGSAFFRKVIVDQMMPYKGPLERDDVTAQMIEVLGGTWPAEAALFPIVAEGKTVALLYCDNAPGGEGTGETEGLEIFISQAGLALEKSLLQRRIQEMESGRSES